MRGFAEWLWVSGNYWVLIALAFMVACAWWWIVEDDGPGRNVGVGEEDED